MSIEISTPQPDQPDQHMHLEPYSCISVAVPFTLHRVRRITCTQLSSLGLACKQMICVMSRWHVAVLTLTAASSIPPDARAVWVTLCLWGPSGDWLLACSTCTCTCFSTKRKTVESRHRQAAMPRALAAQNTVEHQNICQCLVHDSDTNHLRSAAVYNAVNDVTCGAASNTDVARACGGAA
jgi:hypothetical protein